ncbi:MAG: WecB/TagA/CpsF family glycosyltransferase [Nitrospirales bacterium]|nr:WecB/TagA/CpsF family glycosyltransferase [Nitrospira sp.]MDR4502667.1 WecB/TagA/CpsF family glycosyltransferase [Nitrospirales bacterium]
MHTSDPCWPRKFDLFGVSVSSTQYDEALATIIQAARERRSTIVDHMPVHGLIEASRDPDLRQMVNQFDIVAPDGQPVRWALNHFHKAQLSDRVYGPELMLRLCRQASFEGIGVYLLGSTEIVLHQLRTNLLKRFPPLRITGFESPPFRPLTLQEDQALVDRVNKSGAGLIFLGLGCPKQEIFAYDHRKRIHGVQLCVGAAFDFIAGYKPMAPGWMQKHGLEWLFRLCSEPQRLWKRYVITNTIFLRKVAQAMLFEGKISS